jgi:hypothetical protein
LRAKDEKIFKYKTKLESFEAETHWHQASLLSNVIHC